MANKKIPSIKKNIEAFLTSEEGKISQKSALDLGIKMAIISIFACRVVVPRDAQAITSHVAHSDHSDYFDWSDHSDHSDAYSDEIYDDEVHSDHSDHSNCTVDCNLVFCS